MLEHWLRERIELGKDYQRQDLKDDEPQKIEEVKAKKQIDDSDSQEESKDDIEIAESLLPKSSLPKIAKSKVSIKNKIFDRFVFNLNSGLQKETVYITIPNILKETFDIQRWKNKMQ